MHDNSFNRRDFIKLLSVGGAALGVGMGVPTVIGTRNSAAVLNPPMVIVRQARDSRTLTPGDFGWCSPLNIPGFNFRSKTVPDN